MNWARLAKAGLVFAFMAGGSVFAAPLLTAEINSVPIGPLLPQASGSYVSLVEAARALGDGLSRTGVQTINLERRHAPDPPPVLSSPTAVLLSPADLPGYVPIRSLDLSNAALIAQMPGFEAAVEDAGRLDGTGEAFEAPARQVLAVGGPRDLLIMITEFSTWAGAASALQALSGRLASLKRAIPVSPGRLGPVGDASVAYAITTKHGASSVRTLYVALRADNWEVVVVGGGSALLTTARSVWPIAVLQAAKVESDGLLPTASYGP